ncbi:MAG: hypothetical protein QG670_2573 [Thermoproteota archaeon]|nr:hypothetical protein [Thermoproteota archaeon]
MLLTEFTIEFSLYLGVGNVINVGDVQLGSTIVSNVLLALDKPKNVSNTGSLLFQEMTAPVTQAITIFVKGSAKALSKFINNR